MEEKIMSVEDLWRKIATCFTNDETKIQELVDAMKIDKTKTIRVYRKKQEK